MNNLKSVLIVGGGMITHDQILPTVWQMQRQGRIQKVAVNASRHRTLKTLADSPTLHEAFPEASFDWWPAHDGPTQPELFREAIASLPPGKIVMAAVPDPLHFDVVMTALDRNQHVCCVKPLVLRYSQAKEIEAAWRPRSRPGGRHRISQALRRPQPHGAPQISRGPLRRLPPGHRAAHGEVVLPAF